LAAKQARQKCKKEFEKHDFLHFLSRTFLAPFFAKPSIAAPTTTYVPRQRRQTPNGCFLLPK
jgi:hypothetical protein